MGGPICRKNLQSIIWPSPGEEKKPSSNPSAQEEEDEEGGGVPNEIRCPHLFAPACHLEGT